MGGVGRGGSDDGSVKDSSGDHGRQALQDERSLTARRKLRRENMTRTLL